MKTSAQSTTRGFSLVEIATAIAVMAVGVIPLIAMLPVGLANSRNNISKTRGAQLARMVFSTLSGENFTQAVALSPNGDAGSTLDLSVSREADPVVFYASYDPRLGPTVVRTSQAPANMRSGLELYRLELLVHPTVVPGGAGKVAGSTVTVNVYEDRQRQPAFTAQSYIANFKSLGTLASTGS